MKHNLMRIGYIPLVDAAPLIVAREMGFAGEEALSLDLTPAPSWSALRDRLVFGQVEAAHMLAPVPVAGALGLGGAAAELVAVSNLSVNGTVIGVSRALADRLRDIGHDFAFNDARAAGQALVQAGPRPMRIGVPFPFSMHAELLTYWLGALGLPPTQNVEICTVPPPLMARALAEDDIDAFCVGEPWGSSAVEQGVGELLLPGKAIWAFAPEKVLALRADWTQANPDTLARLIRAVWRAGRWLAEPSSRTLASEILAQPQYLDLPAEIIDRSLSGRLTISPRGDQRDVPGFVEFFDGAATFPWRSQAGWIARQLAARAGLDPVASVAAAQQVFRTDLYRNALRDLGADLPGASSKLEGALVAETAVASESGGLFLPRDGFFDGRVFDPSTLD